MSESIKLTVSLLIAVWVGFYLGHEFLTEAFYWWSAPALVTIIISSVFLAAIIYKLLERVIK